MEYTTLPQPTKIDILRWRLIRLWYIVIYFWPTEIARRSRLRKALKNAGAAKALILARRQRKDEGI